jgi:DNA-binding GntR family transcriptional regulator
MSASTELTAVANSKMGPDGRPSRVARPPSLAEHVALVLRDDIVSGRLLPGDRLTEAAVMERTGVSRTPVREGLRSLEAEGLVITHRGRGAYVTYRLSPEEAFLVYDCRLALEPALTSLAAERMTPAALAGIRAVLDRFCDAVDAAPAEAGQLDAEFHLAIYEASGSQLMGVLRGYWTRLQLELSERVYATEVPLRFVREHIRIFQALERGDAQVAGDRMKQHIGHGRQALKKAMARGPVRRPGSERGA